MDSKITIENFKIGTYNRLFLTHSIQNLSPCYYFLHSLYLSLTLSSISRAVLHFGWSWYFLMTHSFYSLICNFNPLCINLHFRGLQHSSYICVYLPKICYSCLRWYLYKQNNKWQFIFNNLALKPLMKVLK